MIFKQKKKHLPMEKKLVLLYFLSYGLVIYFNRGGNLIDNLAFAHFITTIPNNIILLMLYYYISKSVHVQSLMTIRIGRKSFLFHQVATVLFYMFVYWLGLYLTAYFFMPITPGMEQSTLQFLIINLIFFLIIALILCIKYVENNWNMIVFGVGLNFFFHYLIVPYLYRYLLQLNGGS
ncbi:hypothetical protein BH747_00865 [Enterococcus villorum]|uniref:Uncharacterized protein n=2 Tax=Enterococcus villorum TaxID=112904 RepID=A0A1V8YLW4_9ENTE|nr:hypothetical protein BH747_00865 [Enterococcus villorum]OQO73611.1 hypothetical protein BH744_09425 [Enterococcus villorum]